MMMVGDQEHFAILWEWEDCPDLADDGQRITWASVTLV